MKTVQQEILTALLENLREKDLINEDIFSKAREVISQKKEWPDWFCASTA